MFTLDEHHLDEAKKIALNHRKKKSCNHCYDRGWIGVTDGNLLVLCTKCVDMETSMDAWKDYVSNNEDLKEHFSELFEDKPAETEEKEHEKMPLHDHKKMQTQLGKKTFVPGQKRTGLKKV
jgi:hypothetical protein